MNRLSTLLLVLVFSQSLTAAPAADQATLDRVVNEAMSVWQIPGAAVVVVRDGQIVHAKGYGVRELGRPDLVNAETLFGIGSTTKAFTTTGMAMLAADGKLKWDDPVRRHLSYFRLSDPCADSLVTLRDIASHRTGLSRHDVLWDNSPWSREEVVQRIGGVQLSKPFRSAYQYQNIMFIAAGQALAATSGMTWEQFIQNRILQPLGMARTKLSLREAGSDPNHAVGHSRRSSTGTVQLQEPIDDTSVGPAGSMYSSARDFGRWLQFQLAGGLADGRRLLPAEALGETHMPQTIIRMEGSTREWNPETNLMAYALGWVVSDYRGQRLISHTGSLNGFRANIAFVPEKNLGVAILLNVGRSIAAQSIRNGLLDHLLGGEKRNWNEFYQAVDKKSDEEDDKEKKIRAAKRKPNTIPSRDLAAYAGTYRNAGYGDVVITSQPAGLELQWSRLAVPLQHFHFDTFLLRSDANDIDELLVFALNADGQPSTLRLFDEEFRRVE